MMGGAAAAILYAPPAFWRLTGAQRAAFCNGCGTDGIVGLLVPDHLFGLSIRKACDIHDYMYAVGETLADKEEADRVFLNNMLRLVEANELYESKNRFVRAVQQWIERKRILKAHVYFRAVVDFGGPAFWAGKNDPAAMCAVY